MQQRVFSKFDKLSKNSKVLYDKNIDYRSTTKWTHIPYPFLEDREKWIHSYRIILLCIILGMEKHIVHSTYMYIILLLLAIITCQRLPVKWKYARTTYHFYLLVWLLQKCNEILTLSLLSCRHKHMHTTYSVSWLLSLLSFSVIFTWWRVPNTIILSCQMKAKKRKKCNRRREQMRW